VQTRPHIWLCVAALAALACGKAQSKPAPAPDPGIAPPPREPVKPFATGVFAGQSIAVTPLTLVVAVDTLNQVPPFGDRAATLLWADSMVATLLTERGPDVKWVLPPELRKIARRAPSVAPDPDRMGQSLLREKSVETVPDPLRGRLRSLTALVDGRYVFVPASLTLLPEPSGLVRAELWLALVDSRTGKVVWRTLTWAEGSTLSRALRAALENALRP
jgi:hypothetical protein